MLLVIAIFLLALYIYLGLKRPAIALITSPITSIALAFAATFEKSIAVMALAPFVFIAALIAILMSKREPDTERWPQKSAKWILIGFAVLLAIVTAFTLFWPGGGFIFIIFISFLISYMSTSRYATAGYVISTIGSSMQQNLPLAMALESAATGQKGKRARILLSIKKWLVQGYSLSESIKRGYPKCPSRAVAMIAAAEKINQLPYAIKAIVADMTAKADEQNRIKTVYPMYPVIIIIAMFFIVVGLMTFVIPQFNAILTEMFEGAALPRATQILMKVADFIAYQYGWLIGLISFLIIFIIIPVSIRIRFRPRRPDRPYLISRIADFVKWHLPILHWFENNYSITAVVELLRLSLNSGSTVNDAIADTLGLDINNRFKKRLRKWLAKVEAGGNIADAIRESNLGSPLAWAFDNQVNRGNTLAVLETLESFYRSNYNYRINFVRMMMGPCVTIIMGITVGFVNYAIFSSIVAIINQSVDLVTP